MSKKITQFFKPQPSLSKKVGEFDRIKKEDKKVLFSKSCPNFYIAPIKLFWRKSVGGIYRLHISNKTLFATSNSSKLL